MRWHLFCFAIAFFTCITFAYAKEATKKQIIENYGKIPLSFTANEGQYDSQVKFKTNGTGATIFFTQEGTTFLLSRKVQISLTERMLLVLRESVKNLFSLELYEPLKKEELQKDWEYYALKLRFVNANPNPRVVGEELMVANTNYFLGSNHNEWKTNLPNYNKVRLQNLYQGIDLVYYGNQNKIKYDFVVQEGANPAQILCAYDFGNTESDKGSIHENDRGELVVSTPFGGLIERKPYAYQIINGKKCEVEARYKIINSHSNYYTFSIGAYDSHNPLIIDPELSYSTFIALTNEVGNIVVDNKGDVYIAGYGANASFPTSPGAYDRTYNGGEYDGWVFKLSALGSAMLYSTYLGGTGSDAIFDITVDSSGNAYLTGYASSDFPITAGAYDTSFNGGSVDAFVCKLNAMGNALLFSTFMGGNDFEQGMGIALDENCNVYISGHTKSIHFPTTPGSYDSTYNGGEYDLFALKLNNAGSALVYSTFLGGSGDDETLHGIAVNGSHNAYVIGRTASSDFPTTPGAFSRTYNGGDFDAIVSKLNTTGSALMFSTFLGGDGMDIPYSLALDNYGSAYLTGVTISSNFPTTSNAFQTGFGGERDAFVSRLSSDGSALWYSTYLGGIGMDYGMSIKVDRKNHIYVSGSAGSSNFPITSNAYYPSYNSGADAFLCKFSVFGGSTRLYYSTFLGGSGDEDGQGIALDNKGNVYMFGRTNSSNFPVTPGVYDESYDGSYDVWVSKFSGFSTDTLRIFLHDTVMVGPRAFPGDTVSVPVYLDTVYYDYGNGIYSFQMELTYNDSLFQCVGYDSSGTMLSNAYGLREFNVRFRKDSSRFSPLDTLRIAAASQDSLWYWWTYMRRPLIKLKFRIPNTAHNNDSTALHFRQFMFNEGKPTVSTKDGSIKLKLRNKGDVDKNGIIQPIDAILVLRYVIHDTTLDAESQQAAEVSGNGEITAYDASLILQYFVGRITTFPAGSYYKQGLPSNKDADIVMEWREVKDGMISLLVKAKNLSEVYGYSFALSYDPSVLIYEGYQSGEWAKSRTALVRNENGQLRMAVAGVDPLNGDGEIVSFRFKLNSNGDLNRDKLVNLNELVLNEEVLISNTQIASLPKTYSLEQNYPNPFNPETRIRYQLLETRNVQLIVYNLLGQPVRTLVNEMKPAGVYDVRWDGKNDQGINLASGVYIYRIKAGNFVSTRKLIIMK